jgi:hypothetical protein
MMLLLWDVFFSVAGDGGSDDSAEPKGNKGNLYTVGATFRINVIQAHTQGSQTTFNFFSLIKKLIARADRWQIVARRSKSSLLLALDTTTTSIP